MLRTSFLLILASSSLFLTASLRAASAGTEVVELPMLSVSEKNPGGATAASVVSVDTVPTGDAAFSDLARQTAGFAVNDAGARGFGATTTLRGLGNTPYFSDPSTPVYLDDIPLGSGFTFPSELYDFGSMVLYRGPQTAAQFGRAGDAGVIQFRSTEPGPQARGQAGLLFGNYGERTFSISAQTARGADYDASFNAGTSRRDGYIYNTQLGRDVDDREATFGRIKLRYRPAPDLELSLHVLGQRSRDGAQALVPLGGPFFTVSRGKEGEADADFAAIALGITKRLTNATVSSTTSFSDWRLAPYDNRLVVFGGADFDSALTQSQRVFNEELRFAGGPLTGGAFFSRTDTDGAAQRAFSGFPVEDSSFTLSGETMAVFGQGRFQTGADWLLTPGLRLERTEKDFTRTERIPGQNIIRQDNDWNALLPSLSATRHLDAATDLVLTAARGFKPGGYSAYTGIASLAAYAPQSTWGLEAALTTAGPDAKWTFTSRAYAYRVSGYQIERSFAVPSSASDEYLVVNARRAQVLGLELEGNWRPAADVTVRAVAGLTRVTLQDFTDPFTLTNYSGNRAPYAPAGNAALRADYHPARGFFCGAGVTWTGRTFYDEMETAGLSQNAYTLIDASAGYAFARAELRIFGRNLADKAYYSSITPGVAHGTPGAPATWGAAIDCRW